MSSPAQFFSMHKANSSLRAAASQNRFWAAMLAVHWIALHFSGSAWAQEVPAEQGVPALVQEIKDAKAKPEKQRKNLNKAMAKLLRNFPPPPKKT